MSKVGFQDFWVAGTRLYIERSGVNQPLIDLGVISSIAPSVSPTVVELNDADGGALSLVDETLTQITESYDVTVSNMNLENLSLLFLSTAPEAFTQSSAANEVAQTVTKGRLVKIKDATGVALYGMQIAGITAATGSFATHTVDDIVTSSKIVRLSVGDGDVTATYTAGKRFIVNGGGLTNIGNARTFTVVSSAFVSTQTEITVSETPSGDETTLTGVTSTVSSGGVVYTPDSDFQIVSHDRGIVRILNGGTISSGSVKIFSTLAALSGARLLKPQKLKAVTKATAYLVVGRGNNADQSVRECQVSITPNSLNISADDFSNMVLTVKVINDLTATDPAGRFLEFKGSLTDPG